MNVCMLYLSLSFHFESAYTLEFEFLVIGIQLGCVFMHSAILCLLISIFRLYTFKVIIMLGLKPDILLFSVFCISCSSASLFLPFYGLLEHSLGFHLDLFIVILKRCFI